VLEVVIENLQFARTIATQVREHGIGTRHESLEGSAPLSRTQIDRNRLLVVAEGLEKQRVLALLERRHIATNVALAAGIFELDDARAEVGKMHRSPGASTVLLDREDRDIFKWSAHE
jgi:hypothetical protein